jgi:Alpha amylase, catalytic domain
MFSDTEKEGEVWVLCWKRFIGIVPKRRTTSINGGFISNLNYRQSRRQASQRFGSHPQTKPPDGNRWATTPMTIMTWGQFDQKGGVPTWFGSRAELLDLIQSAHVLGLQVYADLVFNHNSGGDAQELNPIDGQSRWTKFTPRSGKFPRDWKCFHPSQYETWDGATFGDMPDLCHRTPLVYTERLTSIPIFSHVLSPTLS